MTPAEFAAVVIGSMAALSLVTFAAMAWDKRAAISHTTRLPESTLHILELLGGWPGSLGASALLRHKTIKARYRLVRVMCIVLHLACVVGVWYAPWGN